MLYLEHCFGSTMALPFPVIQRTCFWLQQTLLIRPSNHFTRNKITDHGLSCIERLRKITVGFFFNHKFYSRFCKGVPVTLFVHTEATHSTPKSTGIFQCRPWKNRRLFLSICAVSNTRGCTSGKKSYLSNEAPLLLKI